MAVLRGTSSQDDARRRGRCAGMGAHSPHDQRAGDRDLGGGARTAHRHRVECAGQRVWVRRLLTRGEDGSAVVGSVFSIIFVLVLALGAIEVAFTLYARNTFMAAVHDGARAAVEIDGSPGDARAVARAVIGRGSGDLVDDLRVDTATSTFGDRTRISVTAAGMLRPPGPLPVSISIETTASTSREELR